MTTVQKYETSAGDALESKLELAEEILDYSDRNIQLTMEILIRD